MELKIKDIKLQKKLFLPSKQLRFVRLGTDIKGLFSAINRKLGKKKENEYNKLGITPVFLSEFYVYLPKETISEKNTPNNPFMVCFYAKEEVEYEEDEENKAVFLSIVEKALLRQALYRNLNLRIHFSSTNPSKEDYYFDIFDNKLVIPKKPKTRIKKTSSKKEEEVEAVEKEVSKKEEEVEEEDLSQWGRFKKKTKAITKEMRSASKETMKFVNPEMMKGVTDGSRIFTDPITINKHNIYVFPKFDGNIDDVIRSVEGEAIPSKLKPLNIDLALFSEVQSKSDKIMGEISNKILNYLFEGGSIVKVGIYNKNPDNIFNPSLFVYSLFPDNSFGETGQLSAEALKEFSSKRKALIKSLLSDIDFQHTINSFL